VLAPGPAATNRRGCAAQGMLERFKGKLAQEEVLATTAKKAQQHKSRLLAG